MSSSSSSTYYNSGSDLFMLNERCLKNGIQSPVIFDARTDRPYIRGRAHIDLYEVFKKELVKSTIFKNKYRTLKLDEVAQSLLGHGKFASDGVNGADVGSMPFDVQKRYVLQDARLVADLLQVNGGQVIALMKAISELVGLGLERTCHTSLSTWWTKVFDDMGCIPPLSQINMKDGLDLTRRYGSSRLEYDYQGGFVIEPKPGLYRDLKVVDVVSLYPSMAILHNISFDTVNCGCCINREDAKVPAAVIDKGYWICKQREGAFPQKLREFKEERIRQKKLGNEVKQLGLKILINGGYGLFGSPAFKYADVRVAEIITAYGRQTLRLMQDAAVAGGFEVIAGDTDSLFLNGGGSHSHENDSTITTTTALLQDLNKHCKEEIGVDIEVGQTFTKAVIIKKKHYFGVSSDGSIRTVGMEGKKSDRPIWVHQVFERFLEDFRREADPGTGAAKGRKHSINDNNNDDSQSSSLIANIRAAIDDLKQGRVRPDDLKITIRLSKNPEEYAVNNPSKRIGLLVGAKKGDTISYWKGEKGVSTSPEDISWPKYVEMLRAALEDSLKILGYDITGLFEGKVATQ